MKHMKLREKMEKPSKTLSSRKNPKNRLFKPSKMYFIYFHNCGEYHAKIS